MKEKITPCLWYDNQAKDAGAFYCEYLQDAKIVAKSPFVTEIAIAGQSITLLNGGPIYQPNASISLFYTCETESEIDRIWKAFAEEGAVLMPLDAYPWSERYGWLNDKYGVSWQFAVGKIEDVGQKIAPCLLFAGSQYARAEEAIKHYSTIFRNTELDGILRYEKTDAPEQVGSVKHAQLRIDSQTFMFMDSLESQDLSFSEGVSLTIHCETQEEIDYYWNKLTEGGEESRCGWLKDKFGVSWQVIPMILSQIMSNPDKADKAAQAFMHMRKFEIEKIVQATL